MEIDEECEKAMIQFVYHHRISRLVELNAVWREFLRIYPLPEEIGVSDLKTHYLCMDRTSNRWGLSEEAFLYFKFGSHAEEMDLNADPEQSGDEDNELIKLLVTFGDRKLKFHSGMSLETLELCRAALLKKKD